MYCRFESGIHPRENIVDIVCTLKDHIESLDDHRLLLEMVSTQLIVDEACVSDVLRVEFTLEKTLYSVLH